ncbi:unnamed protein product [Callosobruchus maculatus]|uniref:LRRCT domain-containing protein n=1 Tax=Callosobruchus maculatus TaxID=64391 RepID=A0A653DQB3_CALMS|nr:unnamed protein product [Callosobruchus maculatus]
MCWPSVLFIISSYLFLHVEAILEEGTDCPSICTCRLNRLSETAINRFVRRNGEPVTGEFGSSENNEVLYDEKQDMPEFLDSHENPIIRSAICILQTETDPLELFEALSETTESLTLIQGYESGNKTFKVSTLGKFTKLVTLELLGASLINHTSNSHLICEVDTPLPDLKFLNLEKVLIRNSKQQIVNFLKEISEEDQTFEYVQRVNEDHALTMLQKGLKEEEIIPYELFKQQREANGDATLFIGFKGLILLRIAGCELNIHWEMFDRLSNLEYLILEKNNLKFIPAFTFYGTPNLKYLSLAHNKLLDIQITDLAGLLELEVLDLSYNNFTQLSELSFPPFPKLKLANFANNPISVIFPNTFEVMNTTNSLIIGSDYMKLTLITNSLGGLNMLEKLTINNLELRLLKRDMFNGLPNLLELIINGNITEIEYDAFLEINKIEKLQLSNCQLKILSMDSFIGLKKLLYLDLSNNNLQDIPPGVFDQLTSLKELYLNGNQFQHLPYGIFSKLHAKLIRLNDNPWECSCAMSDWKPMIINKVKVKVLKKCDYTADKGIECSGKDQYEFKYIYENKVAPKCVKPVQFLNWNLFHAMRRILQCPDYKPKLRKTHIHVEYNTTEVPTSTSKPFTSVKYNKRKMLLKRRLLKRKQYLKKIGNAKSNHADNTPSLKQKISETSVSGEISNNIPMI